MKKNVLIITAALVLCAGLLVVGLMLNRSGIAPQTTVPLDAGLTAQPTPEVAASPSEAPSAAPSQGAATQKPVSIFDKGAEEPLFLVVTVDTLTYDPIPLAEDGDYTINQQGSEASNTIHVTKDSVNMASSTCTNQDCVLQGEVTRANRTTRILGNMIVCLPNKVTLQLCTAQEIAQMLN